MKKQFQREEHVYESDAFEEIIKDMAWPLEEEMQLNPNSGKQEFSIIDPNGYYLTVSEFHKFGA